jgi:phage shock protein E
MNWVWLPLVVFVVVAIYVVQSRSYVTKEKAVQLLHEGGRIVDVRGPGEFASGHLPGAINLPLGSIASDGPRQFPDKSQVLLLHCVAGTRSALARRQLVTLGYTNVWNLGSYRRAEGIVRKVQTTSS